jgi:hypothetical protein
MNITLIWISFILLMSSLEELDQAHFLLFSCSMFYLLYLCNRVRPTYLSSQTTLLLFNFPTIILWYMAFVYNDFLCITPISYEMFMSLFFTYLYITLYAFVNVYKGQKAPF